MACLRLLLVALTLNVVFENAMAKGASDKREELKKQNLDGIDPFSDQFFHLHDFDSNNNLDESEVQAVYDSTAKKFGLPEGPESHDMLGLVWEHIDLDKNRQISLAEFKEATSKPPADVKLEPREEF